MLLPVTPQLYEIETAIEMETIRATAFGDIHVAGYEKPKVVQLEGLFTVNDYPFATSATVDVTYAMDYVFIIEEWVVGKALIRLVIADADTTKINEVFYIDSIKYSESNEDNGDIVYQINLSQYTPMEARVVTTATTAEENTTRSTGEEPDAPSTWTVVSGDSLSKIAREVYGDATKWEDIYNANVDVIGSNANLIFPGQVFKIP